MEKEDAPLPSKVSKTGQDALQVYRMGDNGRAVAAWVGHTEH